MGNHTERKRSLREGFDETFRRKKLETMLALVPQARRALPKSPPGLRDSILHRHGKRGEPIPRVIGSGKLDLRRVIANAYNIDMIQAHRFFQLQRFALKTFPLVTFSDLETTDPTRSGFCCHAPLFPFLLTQKVQALRMKFYWYHWAPAYDTLGNRLQPPRKLKEPSVFSRQLQYPTGIPVARRKPLFEFGTYS